MVPRVIAINTQILAIRARISVGSLHALTLRPRANARRSPPPTAVALLPAMCGTPPTRDGRCRRGELPLGRDTLMRIMLIDRMGRLRDMSDAGLGCHR